MKLFFEKYIVLCGLILPMVTHAKQDHFIKNQGQIRNSEGGNAKNIIAYYKGKDYDVYFQNDKVSYVFKSIKQINTNNINELENDHHYQAKTYRVDMIFDYENETTICSVNKPVEINYRYMNKNNGDLKIKYGYDEIIYYDLYKGIDLKFYFQDDKLKYDFIVHRDANFNKIKMKYEGAQKVIATPEKLILTTPIGTLEETIPEIYQKIGHDKKKIKGEYILLDDNEVSFKLDDYNVNQDVIIDPWATFVGGADIEEAYSTYVDKKKNAYIAGYTGSSDFPVTAGVLQTSLQGQYDAFLTKLDTTGNAIWSMFYGGIGDEFGYEVVVDSKDNPYMVGYTNGNDILVSSSGVFQSNNNGSYDSFILKLDSAGNFIWGTYFGGSGGEFTLAADVDGSDNIVIGGFTSSPNMPRLNPFQPVFGGALDAFVAKFDSTGNLMWSTFCGGSNSEDVHALHIDDQNNVIITGETYSSDFPTSPGAFQPNNNGNLDAFLTKYDDQGNRIFSTCFGGFNAEDGYGVASDVMNNIYLVGYSESLNFPIVGSNVYQSIKDVGKDGFIAKFTPLGQPIISTFIGGSDEDRFKSVMVSSTNSLYVSGYTASTDIPIIGTPYQLNNGGMIDGIYYKLDTTLTPNYSTYIGGASTDFIYDLYVDSDQILTFTGFTSSVDFPVTSNVYQDTIAGQSDAFVFQTDSIFNFTTNIIKYFSSTDRSTVYPNPFFNRININIIDFDETASYHVELYNVLGKQVESHAINKNGDCINLTGKLKEGIYFLSLFKDDALTDSFKLIKRGEN